MKAAIQGARLAYVVKKLEGTVEREASRFDRKTGKVVKEMKEEPAGYLVFFPRGHYLRIRKLGDLKRYRLSKRPNMISLDGLMDPNSPVGRLMSSQDDADRAKAYEDLEADIAEMVRARSGPMSIPGYKGKLPIPVRNAEDSYV